MTMKSVEAARHQIDNTYDQLGREVRTARGRYLVPPTVRRSLVTNFPGHAYGPPGGTGGGTASWAPTLTIHRGVSDDGANDDADGDDSFGLIGHAAVFNDVTVIGEGSFWAFREKILPGAFAKTIKEADVRHLFNHDPSWVLARNKAGTLRLHEDSVGLFFDADLNPNDPAAISVAAKVERGDVTQSSFAFQVLHDEWEESDDDDLPLRTVHEVKLFDTSTVTYPAYASAETMLRAVGLDVMSRALGWDDDMRMRIVFGLATGELSSDLAPAVADAIERLSDFETKCRGAACAAPSDPAAEEAPGNGANLDDAPVDEDHADVDALLIEAAYARIQESLIKTNT